MESSGVPAIQKFSEAQALSERALQLRRARGRRNMARYRERFQAREDALVASVQLLNEDIKKLEIQRRLVASNIPTNTTCWNIVAEYFRLFRYAHKSPNKLFVDQVCPGPSRSDIHRQFIQSTMTADVIGQTGCGTDAILEDYRLVSLYQPDLDCRLVNLENGFEESIVASTRVNITISTSTLQFAFPRLVNDPVKWKALGEKLLGQKFLLCGSVVFKWDTDRQRIVSVHMQADMLTPMLQLLGNLENVASVFDNAMVTPDCSLVLDDVLHISGDEKNERTL
ncbi:hypothetical protein PHMEG_00036903 [Phytophthora megakarya]|uniref:Bzip transcription factor n=1 Tax=Phytophthora megakarya TaxID=4795 RepID=A0A225UNC3_9STRA|nr:hypothetical protein PHMEG_00036903 [Phytophthora megakarya]